MTKLINYITEEEFLKLVRAEKKKEFKLAYMFGFGSGLRISEIVGYKKKYRRIKNKETGVTDFIPTTGEIQPLSAEQIDLKNKTIKIIGGKGMKDRIVPLFPGFKEEYLKLLPLNIKRITLQIHFKTLGKKVLGKNINFHMLRHGFAIMSIKKKVPLPYLQQAMGHSRLDTTGIYTMASPDDMIKGFQQAWGEI